MNCPNCDRLIDRLDCSVEAHQEAYIEENTITYYSNMEFAEVRYYNCPSCSQPLKIIWSEQADKDAETIAELKPLTSMRDKIIDYLHGTYLELHEQQAQAIADDILSILHE